MDGENDGLQAQGEVEQGLAGMSEKQGKIEQIPQVLLESVAEPYATRRRS